jgi:hypothetical protein
MWKRLAASSLLAVLAIHCRLIIFLFVRQPYAIVNFIPPPVRDYELGLSVMPLSFRHWNSKHPNKHLCHRCILIRILKPEIKSISGSTVSAQGHLHRLLVRLPEAVEGGAPTQLLQLQVYGLPMIQYNYKDTKP